MISAGSQFERDLAGLAGLADERIDLGEAALILAAQSHPGRDLARYRVQLDELAAAVARQADDAGTVEAQAATLTRVLVDEWRLTGDPDEDETPENANLMQLLDRRCGPALTLAILWLHVGRAQGWAMEALGFPDHVLVRLTGENGRRVILDPFAQGARLDAAALRDQLKAATGIAAELTPTHYAPLSNRELLLRLQTALKLHHLRLGRLEPAAKTVRSMLLFAPEQVVLWRELGLLRLRLGDARAAVAALEQYVARAPSSTARHRTSALLRELREKMI